MVLPNVQEANLSAETIPRRRVVPPALHAPAGSSGCLNGSVCLQLKWKQSERPANEKSFKGGKVRIKKLFEKWSRPVPNLAVPSFGACSHLLGAAFQLIVLSLFTDISI